MVSRGIPTAMGSGKVVSEAEGKIVRESISLSQGRHMDRLAQLMKQLRKKEATFMHGITSLRARTKSAAR